MNNFIIYFSIWIILVPFFGIPNVWRNYIISLSGFILFCIYIYPIILKKVSVKPPTRKPRAKIVTPKEVSTSPSSLETVPEESAIPSIKKDDLKFTKIAEDTSKNDNQQ